MNRSNTRRVVLGASALFLASAVYACANADEPTADTGPDPVESGAPVFDTSAPPDRDASTDGAPPVCSPAGWCHTPLPDTGLQLSDIWPFADRAFALAFSADLGIKVLEWDGSTWSYIDDGTQNALLGGQTNIYAPNENEVYFGVFDFSMFKGGTTAGQFIFHGLRSAPGTPFTWTSEELPCDHADPSGAVWGDPAGDLYATTCGKIWHRPATPDGGLDAGDGGIAGWVVEHVDDDATYPAAFVHISGSSESDVWFAGIRSNLCTVLLHRTASGYRIISDGKVNAAGDRCVKKGAAPLVVGAPRGLVVPTAGVAVATTYYQLPESTDELHTALRATVLADGGTEIVAIQPPPSFTMELDSVWGTDPDHLWIVGSNVAVVEARSLWNDAGTITFSTLALNGAPNTNYLDVVRGTSDTNLWLVGTDNAIHKTR